MAKEELFPTELDKAAVKTGEIMATTKPDYGNKSSELSLYDREVTVGLNETFEIRIEDVIRALPKINRFNGHTLFPYSVAQHSSACLYYAMHYYDVKDARILLGILLHDAGEAYIGDIVRPVKKLFNGELNTLENSILHDIFALYGITGLLWSENFLSLCQEIDLKAAVTEADALLKHTILPEIPRFGEEYVKIEDWLQVTSCFRRNIEYWSNQVRRSR